MGVTDQTGDKAENVNMMSAKKLLHRILIAGCDRFDQSIVGLSVWTNSVLFHRKSPSAKGSLVVAFLPLRACLRVQKFR